MDNPKISILIPLYNRKQYAAQCIDSALNQTFQEEYEILIRDDCSTDGVFELVKEKYSSQISTGKIKLSRNKKNVGEFATVNTSLKKANGKYIMILHNDDMYLPNALEHLYKVAEKTNADVVHASNFFVSSKGGIINNIQKDCKKYCPEKHTFDKVVIMPSDPTSRFNEWISNGTFIDAQYNIFRKNLLLETEFFANDYDNRYDALWWIMMAKVFVKTPVIHYVRRDSPDSQTNKNFPAENFNKFISKKIEILHDMDKRFSKMDFFRDNEYLQYMAKAHLLFELDNYEIERRQLYSDGITPEIYKSVADSFKKIFGNNYFYPMMLFNWVHVMPYNKSCCHINFKATS